MDLLRVFVIVFLVVHGLGHAIWFMGAWLPARSGVREGPWILPGEVTIRHAAGKVLGLVALGALVAFQVAAWQLFGRDDAWRMTTVLACVASLVAVLPWLRQSPGITAINAIVADIALLVFLLLPLSKELLTA